ncbi:ABC-2 type transport system permease protein [Nocardiopsis arvandica]|uniref:ABC-2 type transport system permease protein n=1 Tax=Nocardiopsis sinuspersici TaxID=501010 RepID=A0A7Z0BL24_9ACTN|nr:antibiotic ABC transporter [Nocardiopsis sinuspersici]NYH54811.1 ABC-2 type transport system permease protein [Nocardiopsis sinuspersici]
MSARAATDRPRPAGRGVLPAGTGHLVRLALRRDRVLIAVWLTATAGIVLGGVAAAEATYPTPEARQERWEQLRTVPVFVLFQSRAFSAGAEALAAQQAFAAATMCAALGAVLLVVRGTRAEESSGRRELLAGAPLGRHADLAAALAVALASGAVLATVVAGGLLAAGLPAAGAVALALVTASAAWVGAGLAAVAVQFATGPGAAAALALGVFYAMHMVRGLGALAGGRALWLTWLVPNGWLENVRPFADERWWALAPVPVWVALAAAAALALADRRDLGSGLLPRRGGPVRAKRWLGSVPALVWRLDRASLLVWASAVAVTGLVVGYAGAGAMAEYADMPWVRAMAAELHVAPADTFFVYVVFAFVFPIAAQAVLTALRVREEERAGTGELLLAGPTGRTGWALAHAAAAFTAPVVLLLVLGAAVGAGSGAGGGEVWAGVARFTALTLSLAPAVWVVVAVTVLAHGAVPRLCAAVGWSVLAVGILTEVAVKAGLVPEALFLLVSPFAHVNPYYQSVPAAHALLVALAAALTAAGVWALRRRDLPV